MRLLHKFIHAKFVQAKFAQAKFVWCISIQTNDGSVFGSSTVCLTAFFLGAWLSIGLSQLPDENWLFISCILIILLCVVGAVWRALVFCLLGFAWVCFSIQTFLNTPFPDQYERVDFVASGDIEGLPVSRAGNVQFRFKIGTVANNDLSALIGKRLQLSCYRCPHDIRAGERWRLTVRVKRPHGYASWGAFDYEKYLFRHRVIANGYLRLKQENQRLEKPASSIHHWRQSLLDELQDVIGIGVGANIISALTIGVKSGFSNQQQQVFQTTGVSHLMAISGLHVGLVFVGASFLLKYLLWPMAGIFETYPRQRFVLAPALMAATFYAALAGFSVSTQRALTMLLVFVVCKFLAREANLSKVLLIAIVVLLIIDPFSILDIGFWLSCSAVAVIALTSSTSERHLDAPGIEQRLALPRLQAMLWLGMLPLSVIFFGKVSLISPMINLFAVPLFCIVLIPATLLCVLMFCLGAKTLAGWCLLQLSHVFDYAYQLLEIVSRFEFSKIYATPFTWWQWLIFILVVATYLKPMRGRSALGALLILTVFINTARPLPKDELQVSLLDVGQGLSMVIETPNSVTVYDTGPRYGTGFTAAEAVLLPFLRHRGIRRIDTLVISHADNDHIGGLETLSKAFPIDHIISSRVDKVTGAEECFAGQAWYYDQTKFSVISPQADTPKGSNNRSCVIMLHHRGNKILLSGDIEKQVERFLVKNSRDQLKADILLVPHQGSKTSSTTSFLDAVSPSMAMLAAGYKNHYGHPHPSVVERYRSRGIELLSTIEHGSVLLKFNSQGWSKVLYRQRYRRFWHH